MDSVEKAKVRLEHWISHNVHHQEEYEMFMEQLQKAGKIDSADQILQLIDLTSKSTECMRKALDALG